MLNIAKVIFIKKAKRGLYIVLYIAMSTLATSSVHASVKDVHEIIDVCTSAQRILKDYALIGIGTTYHNPKKDMEETVKRLNEELKDLESHDVSKSLHEEEVALHKEWDKIEEKVRQTPDKKSIFELYKMITKFTKHCEVLAEHLAADTGIAAEHDVVLIAELNMEVQRLVGLYAVRTWDGVTQSEFETESKIIIKEYNDILGELLHADDKLVSKKVKSHLKGLSKYFTRLELTIENSKENHVPALVAKRAEVLYVKIKEILLEEEHEVEK